MTVFAEALITLMVIALVLYPLFRREQEASGAERLGELRLKRDNAYIMLGEIESDREAGTLSEEDYRKLMAKYQQQANGTLKEINRLSGFGGGDVNEAIEKGVKELRRGKRRFCARCGAPVMAGDHFCPKCGKSLAR